MKILDIIALNNFSGKIKVGSRVVISTNHLVGVPKGLKGIVVDITNVGRRPYEVELDNHFDTIPLNKDEIELIL